MGVIFRCHLWVPETGLYHQFMASVIGIYIYIYLYDDDKPSKFEGTSFSDKPKYHSKTSTVFVGILSQQPRSNPSIATVRWTCSPAQVALREQHEKLDVSPAIWWVCWSATGLDVVAFSKWLNGSSMRELTMTGADWERLDPGKTGLFSGQPHWLPSSRSRLQGWTPQQVIFRFEVHTRALPERLDYPFASQEYDGMPKR